MAELKKTLVLGASANPQRYSYLAINRLRNRNYPVIGIGKKPGKVGDVEILAEQMPIEGIDTITLYLNASNQKQYYDFILSLQPRRIIFNPGAENDELYEMAQKNGIQAMEACTLVFIKYRAILTIYVFAIALFLYIPCRSGMAILPDNVH